MKLWLNLHVGHFTVRSKISSNRVSVYMLIFVACLGFEWSTCCYSRYGCRDDVKEAKYLWNANICIFVYKYKGPPRKGSVGAYKTFFSWVRNRDWIKVPWNCVEEFRANHLSIPSEREGSGQTTSFSHFDIINHVLRKNYIELNEW